MWLSHLDSSNGADTRQREKSELWIYFIKKACVAMLTGGSEMVCLNGSARSGLQGGRGTLRGGRGHRGWKRPPVLLVETALSPRKNPALLHSVSMTHKPRVIFCTTRLSPLSFPPGLKWELLMCPHCWAVSHNVFRPTGGGKQVLFRLI